MSILFGVYLGIFTYKYKIENYFFKYEEKVNIRNIKDLLWTKLFILVIIISICEELLFRLVSFDIFSDIFNNNLITVVVTAIFFGLNHIIFGIKQVFIKLFIGLFMGFCIP
jgi:membrane protease YdiL (CAAX protease family)